MAGFTSTASIARAPQEVFAFVAGPENAPTVVQGVTSMVLLTDGPVGVGSRLRETRRVRGKEEHAELEVVAFEPPRRYAVRNVTQGIETVYRYDLRAEGDGTRVDLTCEITASGAKKLMLPVVAAVLKKEDGDHLQRVKKALEQ